MKSQLDMLNHQKLHITCCCFRYAVSKVFAHQKGSDYPITCAFQPQKPFKDPSAPDIKIQNMPYFLAKKYTIEHVYSDLTYMGSIWTAEEMVINGNTTTVVV